MKKSEIYKNAAHAVVDSTNIKREDKEAVLKYLIRQMHLERLFEGIDDRKEGEANDMEQ